MDHIELIEAASVAYLSTLTTGNPPVSVWPVTMVAPGGGLMIYPGENNLDKQGQRIVCYVAGNELGDEDPPNSGNRWAEITWELRTPVFRPTALQIKTGVVDPLGQHKLAVEALEAAALDSTLPDNLTAAVAGFTCFGFSNRTQIREEQENGWMSGWRIKLYSCPASFPN